MAWLECLDQHASVVLIGPSLVPRLSCVGGEPGNEAIDLSQNQNQPQCVSLYWKRYTCQMKSGDEINACIG